METSAQARAIFWMILSICSFVVMSVAGRALTSKLEVFQVMEMRSIIGLVLILPLVWSAGGLRAMRTKRPMAHVGRNVAHYSGQFAWFLALGMIPLAELISIEFTVPFWVALMAVAFLGERMNMQKAAAVLFGFVGVALIVRPGVQAVQPGHLIILAGALAFGISVVMVKSLTRTESVVRIIFWMLIIQSIIGLVPAIMVWTTPTADLWLPILVVAATGTFSHYFQARALANADATLIIPLDFLRLPMTAVVGYLLYGEGFDMIAVAGAALILIGNLMTLRAGRQVAATDAP